MYTGKISFCTSVMGRLHHLKQTLPANLGHADSDTEFVLVNYSDTEGLHEWVVSMGYDHHPQIHYHVHEGEKYFRMSHSKNLTHGLASGDYVVNLDADYFIGPNLMKELREAITPNSIINCKNLYGFIGMSKIDFFEKMGGYDEAFVLGWGYDDDDLRARCKAAQMNYLIINPAGVKTIFHRNAERISRTGQESISKSFSVHKKISNKNIREGRLKANVPV
jgi:hypothetical protein